MARYGSEKIRGHGIPEAIEAILFGKSQMSPKVAMLKPLSSGIVIGSGGPFGAEGPIIMTGGALGSLIAQCVHLTSRRAQDAAGRRRGRRHDRGVRHAGGGGAARGRTAAVRMAAAQLAAGRPRVRRGRFRARRLLRHRPAVSAADAPRPTLVAAVVRGRAGCCPARWLGTVTRPVYTTEDLFGKLPMHWMWWPAIGGLVVGIGGFIEPRALGVGYDVIGDLLHQHIACRSRSRLLVVKAIIWVGRARLGHVGRRARAAADARRRTRHRACPWLPGSEPALWPLVCMAATLGATLGAPLTAIVFAFGLTHDTNALLPLLAATLVAHGSRPWSCAARS